MSTTTLRSSAGPSGDIAVTVVGVEATTSQDPDNLDGDAADGDGATADATAAHVTTCNGSLSIRVIGLWIGVTSYLC